MKKLEDYLKQNTFEDAAVNEEQTREEERKVKRYNAIDLDEAKQKGYDEGIAAGKEQALQEHTHLLNTTFENLSQQFQLLADSLNQKNQELQKQTAQLLFGLFSKISPSLQQAATDINLEDLIQQAIQDQFTAPTIRIFVHQDMLDSTKEKLSDPVIHQGYQGQLEVIAGPDLKLGDCKIDWESGGFYKSIEALEEQIKEIFSQYGMSLPVEPAPAPPPDQPPEEG